MKLDPSLMRIARRCRRHSNYHRTPAQRAELRTRLRYGVRGLVTALV